MKPHSCRRGGTFPLPQALVLFLTPVLCAPNSSTSQAVVAQADTEAPLNLFWAGIKTLLLHPLFRLLSSFTGTFLSSFTFVGMVQLTALCGIGSAICLWKSSSKRKQLQTSSSNETPDTTRDDAAATDPGLLKKHSTIRSYTVSGSGITYPGIRTFYRPHPQGSKLPTETLNLPLLVFIHGLGGSIAQFHPILVSLVNLAPCLAIDLPGCGLSSFEPKSWEAYTTEALVRLLAEAIEAHRDPDRYQPVILIGHSMGCSLAALLASSSSPYRDLISQHVWGLIAICPKADPPTPELSKNIKRITSVPAPLFDVFRKLDRRGGLNSKSVIRMTGDDADEATKKLQLRFNRQSRTPVWQRMVRGTVPDYSTGQARGGLPGKEVWGGLKVPVFLAAGEADTVTPPENVFIILQFLGREPDSIEPTIETPGLEDGKFNTAILEYFKNPRNPGLIGSESAKPDKNASTDSKGLSIENCPVGPDDSQTPPDSLQSSRDLSTSSTVVVHKRKHQDSGVDASDLPKSDDYAFTDSSEYDSGAESEKKPLKGNNVPALRRRDFKNKGNSLYQEPSDSDRPRRRPAVKFSFLPSPASHTLPFATSSSRTLAGLIGDFLFVQIDPRLSLGWQLQYLCTEGKWDVKNLAKWKDVQPVSSPIGNVFRAMKTLREVDEHHSPKEFVKDWKDKIRVVVDISHESPVYDPKGLEDGGIAYRKFPTVSKLPPTQEEVTAFIALIDKTRNEFGLDGKDSPLIGIHCHYGFNRTGFFVVSYLVERLKYRLEDAIEEFAVARRPGIRHQHFIDALHVRYCVGLRKAPTL